MKLFLTSQIRNLDAYTMEQQQILSSNLMERAATAFVDKFCTQFSPQQKVYVFAGPGNNGGDALAIARMLIIRKYLVRVFLLNPKNNLSSDTDINLNRLELLQGPNIVHLQTMSQFPELEEKTIIIDGLLGSGLNKPTSGIFASVIKKINKSLCKVVSIDMPSGLFGEDNLIEDVNTVVCADYTYTFQFHKLSFLFSENEKYVGQVEVLDIGLSRDAILSVPTPYQLLLKEFVVSKIKPRSKFSHKGNLGHALLIAGSKGKMGTAVLGAKACLRIGAGLVTAHIPQSGVNIMQACVPEAMVTIDADNDIFTDKQVDISSYQTIAIGPGLSTNEKTVIALKDLFKGAKLPVIVDADALNIISSDLSLLDLIPKKSILTPHPKEFDRLCGQSASSYERLQKARKLASDKNLYVILKGRYTSICDPDGNCFFNSTGNPGMATAGSGDVLTGTLLGLVAQGYTPLESSIIGVFIHGLAGDLALSQQSEESLLSGDIIEYLGKAFKEIKS